MSVCCLCMKKLKEQGTSEESYIGDYRNRVCKLISEQTFEEKNWKLKKRCDESKKHL